MHGVAADHTHALGGSRRPLAEVYDVALLDLDGVVYIGSQAVHGACEALRNARQRGMRLAFVTNNAARPPAIVAKHLTELGIPASEDEVVTSAQAAAHYLSERLPIGANVLVIGTVGLVEALAERGLVAVKSADDEPVAVVQGYSPDLDWAQLAEGAIAINRGLPWVATNVDPTVPSRRGPLPGNGSLVAALRHATGATPVVTGKPQPTMHAESVQRSRARNPLVVGDRLDTDIEGANAVGCASLLVLSGVTTPAEVIHAPPVMRPTYLGRDLFGLLQAHIAPTESVATVRCGRWTARMGEDAAVSLELSGLPEAGPEAHVGDEMGADRSSNDGLDALRAVCVAAWRLADAEQTPSPTDRPGRTPRVQIAALDGDSARELERLGLGPS